MLVTFFLFQCACLKAQHTLEWITIGTEAKGETGSSLWRYLDFGSMIYDVYDVSQIKQYKFEWNVNSESSYTDRIIFELADVNPNHKIFEDSLDSIHYNIKINIVSSTNSVVGVGHDQLFCKACSSSYGTRWGDTCWAILDFSDTNRNCGCNSGGWTGSGIYYGGTPSSPCTCGCHGGAFAGYKSSGQAKGDQSSVGVRLSIGVLKTDAPTSIPTTNSPSPKLRFFFFRTVSKKIVIGKVPLLITVPKKS
eukprot:619758_1